jgi:hypothetical protein
MILMDLFPLNLSGVRNGDLVGLVEGGLFKCDFQETVFERGRHIIRINGGWKIEYPFEGAVLDFRQAVGRGGIRRRTDPLAMDLDGTVVYLHIQIFFGDPGNFGDDDDFVGGLKNIHGRFPGTLGAVEGRIDGPGPEKSFDGFFQF